ncbi:PREDICTED: pupal cuticle protein 36 [Rhagoletis zephyria]|uniref:pupal cuticle protein 36 n=1 Tax=Rhagoletis zephyria TaxID=28612 RepID=UPI0008118CEF|nr:PREDICTED: pupal cuticle protein 36 [Rhagoletis zephyria]
MGPKLTLGALVFVVAVLATVRAQNDGRYRAPVVPAIARARARPTGGANDGRYRPSNDGRYRGGNDGKYVHVDVPYVHDDRAGGEYKGEKDRFGPGGGGGGGAGAGGRAGASGRGSGAGRLAAGSGALGAGAASGAGLGAATTTRRPAPKPAALDLAAKLPKGKGTGEGGNGWRILQLFDKEEKDGYRYIYETENGILAEENGRIEKLAPDADGLRSAGFYEYTGDDGVLYRVDYVADDNGFVPQGAHLPTPPPYVAKLLAHIYIVTY